MKTNTAFQSDSGIANLAPRLTSRLQLVSAIHAACGKIAPLWPLKHFVAVNSFLGFSNQSFAATCANLERVAGTRMLMPRAFYREALANGTVTDCDLLTALSRVSRGSSVPFGLDALKRQLNSDAAPPTTSNAVVATVAEVLDRLAAGNRQVSRTAFMVDEISKFCAAYFDEAQAHWQQPWRGLPLYAAWRAAARFDRNPEVMGIRGFRKSVAILPGDPLDAIENVVRRLGIPERALGDYLHRALMDIGGWAAYARYLVWNSELCGDANDTLIQLLAIRVVWGYALFRIQTDDTFQVEWRKAMLDAAEAPQDEQLNNDPQLACDLILQDAYELSYQRKLIATFGLARSRASDVAIARRPVQAAFCIDVRSEVYRRSLELVFPEIETVGFAGFFGFPIEYIPIGQTRGGARCPVLLKPGFVVCEAVQGAAPELASQTLRLRLLRRRVAKAWKMFKASAVSAFSYVETAGFLYLAKLIGDSVGLTRTVPDPNLDGFDAGTIDLLGPSIEPGVVAGRLTGFDPKQRIAMAEAVLRAMSMTRDFARIVMLTGHGSTTVNNPHASGLDCGACGGHTGEANARVAAAILNDPDVRNALEDKGIKIPTDTWFVGCLHDTTTDHLRIFDEEAIPATHSDDLLQLKEKLAQASALARIERAMALGIAIGDHAERRVLSRSRDWSQVRPEWGLAGNAAFIAAPRGLTRDVDLGGRAFLHNYNWQEDPDFKVLSLIMTAPMVVASWINLQYYGSTVNNRVFGSGNKVLHNVTGALGVLEGNAGDLKVGLPLQSVHDGKKFVHEPLRLSVFIAAPPEAICDVIAKNASVRDLVENSWVHLFRIDDRGSVSHRYQPGLGWSSMT